MGDGARARPGRRTARGGGHGVVKFLLGLVALLAVIGGILSFVDIGGDLILGVAKEQLKKQARLELTAEGVSGNPLKGYRISDFSVATESGDRLLSARSLSASLNFSALLRGSLRLANLSVGGVDMDLDQLLDEVRKLELPQGGSGGGEVPLDRISLTDSRFTSKWGVVQVKEVGANVHGGNLDVDADGTVNGVPVRGDANLDVSGGTTIGINRSNVSFGRGKISVTGGIHPLSEQNTATTLDLQGAVQGLDLQELMALLPALDSNDYSGTANLSVEASGTIAALKVTSTVNYRGTRLGGYPVERVAANVDYSGGRIFISNIDASALNVPITGAAAVNVQEGKAPSVTIKLEGTDAALEGLEKTFPALAGLGGRVSSFRANIQGPLKALNGAVNLTAPRVSWRGRTATDVRAQLKLANSDSATLDGKFNFEGAKGFLNGKVASLLTGPRMDLKATLQGLDLARVAAMIPGASQYDLAGQVTTRLVIRGGTSSPSISGTIESPAVSAKLSGQPYALDKPSVSFAYAGGTLTIQKSSGTLNGMPVNLAGRLGPLTSARPPIDMSATLTIAPAALEVLAPQVRDYSLKGNVSAGIKLTGRLPAPHVDLVASSANLSAMTLLTVRGLELSTALDGGIAALNRLELSARAASVEASGTTLTDVTAKVSKAGDAISLAGFSARSGGGSITGSGTAGSSPDSRLNLTFNLDRLDLKPLAQASGLALKGVLTGSVGIGGTVGAPTFSFNGSAPSVTAQGLTLTNLTTDASGTQKELKINAFKAEAGGAPLSASGTVQFAPLSANLSIRGTALDLAALTKDYPDAAGQISGKADLTFNVTGGAGGLSGKGALTSPALKAFGLNLTEVNLPLSYSGSTFASSGGTAKLYGGSARNSLTFDTGSLKFSDELSADGLDVNALLQDVTGGLGGRITGRGQLGLKLNGSAAKGLSYAGTGQFTMGEGAVTGFSGLDIVTRLYGTQGIRYVSVKAPFTLKTGKLILHAGAEATAPERDPLYRYARIASDGVVNFDKTLNVPIELMVNYQLVNALTGGGTGALGGLLEGGTNVADTLKQALGGGLEGAQKGGARADFRTVTLTLKGKADAPSVKDLKIGPSALKDESQSAAVTATSVDQGTPAPQPSVETPAPQPSVETPTPQPEAPETKDAVDRITDRVLDAIIPSGNEDQDQQQAATQDDEAQKGQGDQIKDQLKEELGKELKKGLEGLFN